MRICTCTEYTKIGNNCRGECFRTGNVLVHRVKDVKAVSFKRAIIKVR